MDRKEFLSTSAGDGRVATNAATTYNSRKAPLKTKVKQRLLALTCNLRIWEAEAGGFCKSEAILGYRPCLKNTEASEQMAL